MKSLVRNFLYNLFALSVTSSLINGFKYSGGLYTLIYAALLFTLINIFIKPLIKLLAVPLNFLSLGLFSWLINVSMLYLLTLLVSGIKIIAFRFNGFSAYGFVLPSFNLTILYSYIIVSFIISLITNFLHWLSSK